MWSLQKHFNEDSLTPAADMNSTVKVLLLIVCVLMYASIVRCASVSRNSIDENQTDIHSIPSNYQLTGCKFTGGKCVTEKEKTFASAHPNMVFSQLTSCKGTCMKEKEITYPLQ
ncbi:hypothetical protein CEXT_620711 [Caerostris extrusa]|uniref:Secreted protein n=1 Tax=Caerostris extrusa TaxID=172846 RepID=A0AAV4WEI0_CAEEX|nr:hypothetical protein CEXT_620711 [Caerostris extrusa]